MFTKLAKFQDELERNYFHSRHTSMAYASDIRQLARYLEVMAVMDWSALTVAHVEQFLEYEVEAGLSAATVQRRLASIRLWVRFLNLEGIINADFSDELHLPRMVPHEARVVVPLSEGEVAAILAALGQKTSGSGRGQRDRALFVLLLETGMKVGQALMLNTDAVVTDTSGMQIQPDGAQPPFPLEPWASEIVAAYIKTGRPVLLNMEDERSLFVSQLGRRMTRQSVWVMLRHLGVAAGLDSRLTPRRIRYTRAHRLLQAGMGLEELQQRMGHRVSLSTRYMEAVLRGRSRENGAK